MSQEARSPSMALGLADAHREGLEVLVVGLDARRPFDRT